MNKIIPVAEPSVLIVEDGIALRALARSALENLGFAVREAADGLAGLEMLREEAAHLIILDVRMPGIDGFETCRRIRSLPRCQDVPILMMTGLEDIDSINKAYEAGATDFFTKPVNWALFGHRVRYMLRAANSFRELRSKEARLAEAQRIARLGYFAYRPAENVVICSEELRRIFALPLSGIRGHEDFLAYVEPDDREFVREARQEAILEGRSYDIRYRMIAGDGTERFVNEQARSNPHLSTGHDQLIGTVQDITERNKIEEQIQYLAYHDSLTGLPNRVQFEERFREALERAQRDGTRMACLFIDVDRFKRVNDSYGHTAGDDLLQRVANRLQAAVERATRTTQAPEAPNVLARFGGDEFTVLLGGVRDDDEVAAITRSLSEAMNEPFRLYGAETFVTASIGISRFPDDGGDVAQLFKRADSAMYAAKGLGRNNFQFYSATMQDDAPGRLTLQSRLHRAVEREEFELHYQPIVDTRTGELRKLECLVRWVHPEDGVVAPDAFIPAAEESGLILPIGRWVIAEAFRQSREWRDAGLTPPAMAVNLSARQFQQADIAETVAELAARHGCDPSCLELEITESTLMESSEASMRILDACKSMGVGLSVDDFGTGYSSLAYLKRFPLDSLKIDRSFITDVDVDTDDASIVAAIVAMAHNLRLGVVAEGVEERPQLDYLRSIRCDMVQGYLFAAPRPATFVTPLVRSRSRVVLPRVRGDRRERTG